MNIFPQILPGLKNIMKESTTSMNQRQLSSTKIPKFSNPVFTLQKPKIPEKDKSYKYFHEFACIV